MTPSRPKGPGTALVALLLASAQVDLSFQLGSLTVFHNEILLACVAGLGLGFGLFSWKEWRAPLLACLPLFAWLLLHGLWPGPAWEGVKAALRAGQPLLGLALPVLLVKDEESWRLAAWAAVAALAVSAVWALAQSLSGPGQALNLGREFEVIHGFQAAAAGMGHHNQLGAALIAGLALCAALGSVERRPWTAGAAALLLLAALGCTFSRGAWVGAAILAACLLPLAGRKALAPALVAGLALSALALVEPALRLRLMGLGGDSDRLAFWRALLPHLRANWAWGVNWDGAAEAARAAAAGLGRDPGTTRSLASHAHNFYLQQALAFGLPVLGLWVAPLGLLAARAASFAREPEAKAFALAFIGCLLGLAFQSATDLLTLHARGLLPALMMGLLLAGARIHAGNRE